jgi:hypothetical protein
MYRSLRVFHTPPSSAWIFHTPSWLLKQVSDVFWEEESALVQWVRRTYSPRGGFGGRTIKSDEVVDLKPFGLGLWFLDMSLATSFTVLLLCSRPWSRLRSTARPRRSELHLCSWVCFFVNDPHITDRVTQGSNRCWSGYRPHSSDRAGHLASLWQRWCWE